MSDDEASDVQVQPFAQPLADGKLSKKIFKCIKKATKSKQVLRGVKEVVKAVRKGQKGICVIAGNISPMDVISHLPILCEENHVPYIYVNAKEELGAAALTKRPTSCMLIAPKLKKDLESPEGFDELLKNCLLYTSPSPRDS
eukprot:TRINITY_DN4149_c0_g1_i8.p1 TRINITY_DN4149_c0_g1~~TRINITY_DN4149_c0_g1_i8.p1  ORF type:complete len:142 (-),score=42.17 TRINITY_DN4149_c0_g1_i8:50-475(-)